MSSKKTLLAGPWIGEFGWELFVWQGYIRSIAHQFDEVIVSTRVGNEFLYEDFTNNFKPIDLPPNASSDSWFCRNIPKDFVENFVNSIPHTHRIPARNIGFLLNGNGVAQTSPEFLSQKFVKYESNSLEHKYDIIIHPRNKDVGSDRNWDKDKWQKLVDLLGEDYTIAEIGNNEAFKLDGVDDYRNIRIQDTVSLMNRCKLVIGQSSGPLHLASLCGTPHLVWSTEYNRNRYTKYWNAHNTTVYFYSEMGWNPTVEFIEEKIRLNLIGV